MRIACVIASMQAAGAQRVMAQLCNHFAALGHATTLFTLEPAGTRPFFALDPAVDLRPLGRPGEGGGLARALRVARWIAALRGAIRTLAPDVVVSFIDLANVMVLIATRRLGIPVIVSERIDPHVHAIGRAGVGLRRLTYPHADAVVVQTARAARYFADAPLRRLEIIANPVPTAAALAKPAQAHADGRCRLIGVGRLHRQKGFDLLVPAFAPLARRFPGWDVAIYGAGEEQAALDALIAEAGLAGRFVIHPPTPAIRDALAGAHAMAFPSRYEGFPNALAEAMAAGLPATGFRDVSGVEDLIEHGRTGLLAEWGASEADAVHSLSSQLAALMASPGLRQDLGEAARRRTQDFAPAAMLGRWEELVVDVVRRARARR